MEEIEVMRSKKPKIHSTAVLEAFEFKIGDWSVIGPHVRIRGESVVIGRAAQIEAYATIGGSRAELGSLETGDFFHMGEHSFVDTTRNVIIGHEVGLGRFTNLYTHGGYLSAWEGFPHLLGEITIGSRVWLPKATVLPNVNIGDRVVVGVESLVNKDLPSGCMAGGNPVRIIKENAYPLGFELPELKQQKLFSKIIASVLENYGFDENIKIVAEGNGLLVENGNGGAMFLPTPSVIHGSATEVTELVRELLGREGIRFRYYVNKKKEYEKWPL